MSALIASAPLAVALCFLLCAALLHVRAQQSGDRFLAALAFAFVLMAATRFISFIPMREGEPGWVYLPKLAALLIILWHVLRLRLAR